MSAINKSKKVKHAPIILTDNVYEEGDIKIVTESNCDVSYYKKGKLHRDGDLPAVIKQCGEWYWYQNGKLHRELPKPAGIVLDEDSYSLEWHIKGKYVSSKYSYNYRNGVIYYDYNDKACMTAIPE
jgi:hypothetical protein